MKNLVVYTVVFLFMGFIIGSSSAVNNLFLNDIEDVSINSPSDGEALIYDSVTSNWTNTVLPSGSVPLWSKSGSTLYTIGSEDDVLLNNSLYVGEFGESPTELEDFGVFTTRFLVANDCRTFVLQPSVRWGAYNGIGVTAVPTTGFMFPNSDTMQFYQDDDNVIEIGSSAITFNKNNTDHDYDFGTINYDDTLNIDAGLDQVIMNRGLAHLVTHVSTTLNDVESYHNTIVCDTSSNAVILYLPSIDSVGGQILEVIKSTSGNYVQLDADGTDTINGGGYYNLQFEGESCRIIADDVNDNWIMISVVSQGILDFALDMNQSVYNGSDVWFGNVTVMGWLSTTGTAYVDAINTGYGSFVIGQSLRIFDDVTFGTVDTGQGANELYDMNQNVLTTSSPTFDDITLTSYSNLDKNSGDDWTFTVMFELDTSSSSSYFDFGLFGTSSTVGYKVPYNCYVTYISGVHQLVGSTGSWTCYLRVNGDNMDIYDSISSATTEVVNVNAEEPLFVEEGSILTFYAEEDVNGRSYKGSWVVGGYFDI